MKIRERLFYLFMALLCGGMFLARTIFVYGATEEEIEQVLREQQRLQEEQNAWNEAIAKQNREAVEEAVRIKVAQQYAAMGMEQNGAETADEAADTMRKADEAETADTMRKTDETETDETRKEDETKTADEKAEVTKEEATLWYIEMELIEECNTVSFQNETLEAAVRQQLGAEEGPLLRSQVANLRELRIETSASERVRLEFCEEDLALLSGLESLYVDVSESQLDNYDKYGFIGNRVGGYENLELLPNLLYLNISDMQLADIEVLAGIKSLEQLTLTCSAKDISPLEELPNLELVWLVGMNISDLSPLLKIDALTYLNLSYSEFDNAEILGDLTGLECLYLQGCGLSDISFVSNMKQLRRLELADNELREIDAVYGLPELNVLRVTDNSLKEAIDTEKLENLIVLWCDEEDIMSVDAVEDIPILNVGEDADPAKITGDGKILLQEDVSDTRITYIYSSKNGEKECIRQSEITGVENYFYGSRDYYVTDYEKNTVEQYAVLFDSPGFQMKKAAEYDADEEYFNPYRDQGLVWISPEYLKNVTEYRCVREALQVYDPTEGGKSGVVTEVYAGSLSEEMPENMSGEAGKLLCLVVENPNDEDLDAPCQRMMYAYVIEGTEFVSVSVPIELKWDREQNIREEVLIEDGIVYLKYQTREEGLDRYFCRSFVCGADYEWVFDQAQEHDTYPGYAIYGMVLSSDYIWQGRSVSAVLNFGEGYNGGEIDSHRWGSEIYRHAIFEPTSDYIGADEPWAVTPFPEIPDFWQGVHASYKTVKEQETTAQDALDAVAEEVIGEKAVKNDYNRSVQNWEEVTGIEMPVYYYTSESDGDLAILKYCRETKDGYLCAYIREGMETEYYEYNVKEGIVYRPGEENTNEE